MSKFTSKYFGEIDLTKGNEDHYDATIEFGGKTVSLTLYKWGQEALKFDDVASVEEYLDNFEENEAKIRDTIHEDFESGGIAKEHLELAVEFDSEEELGELTAGSDQQLPLDQKLLSMLYITQIWFYPDAVDDIFAKYDYTTSEELTDDVLSAIVHKDFRVNLASES